MYRTSKLIVLTTAAALFISACGNQEEPQSRSQSYDNDGYLGFTNTNPNLHTSPTYHNQSEDTEMIERAVGALKFVKKSKVVYYGPNAYVTLQVQKGLSEKQKSELRADAYEMIQLNLPRYIVTLKLKEER
jgi:hypothetical protein